ncbi:MAG: hypothetical protein M1484_02920 [Patescibacteria group bacterium]|nr:hypothetical protein [Patescibacteria group bacterium]
MPAESQATVASQPIIKPGPEGTFQTSRSKESGARLREGFFNRLNKMASRLDTLVGLPAEVGRVIDTHANHLSEVLAQRINRGITHLDDELNRRAEQVYSIAARRPALAMNQFAAELRASLEASQRFAQERKAQDIAEKIGTVEISAMMFRDRAEMASAPEMRSRAEHMATALESRSDQLMNESLAAQEKAERMTSFRDALQDVIETRSQHIAFVRTILSNPERFHNYRRLQRLNAGAQKEGYENYTDLCEKAEGDNDLKSVVSLVEEQVLTSMGERPLRETVPPPPPESMT